MGQDTSIFPPKWDEIPNSHFGFHFFDSFVSIRSPFGFPGSSQIVLGRIQHRVSGKEKPARIEVRSRQ